MKWLRVPWRWGKFGSGHPCYPSQVSCLTPEQPPSLHKWRSHAHTEHCNILTCVTFQQRCGLALRYDYDMLFVPAHDMCRKMCCLLHEKILKCTVYWEIIISTGGSSKVGDLRQKCDRQPELLISWPWVTWHMTMLMTMYQDISLLLRLPSYTIQPWYAPITPPPPPLLLLVSILWLGKQEEPAIAIPVTNINNNMTYWHNLPSIMSGLEASRSDSN